MLWINVVFISALCITVHTKQIGKVKCKNSSTHSHKKFSCLKRASKNFSLDKPVNVRLVKCDWLIISTESCSVLNLGTLYPLGLSTC